MNLNDAMDAIYGFGYEYGKALAFPDCNRERLSKLSVFRKPYLDAVEFVRSLEIPQWHRHEGGTYPDGILPETVVAVVYDDNETIYSGAAKYTIYSGAAKYRAWDSPLWYYVIPAPPTPPAPPKAERWRAEMGGEYWAISSAMQPMWYFDDRSYQDNIAYEIGNYFRTQADAEAARPAILAAFKQVNEETNKV